MYLEHFKLKELPFRLGADARFHFLGVMQETVKSQLRQGLVECDGCMLLTGEAGVGKSVLIDDLLPALPDHYRIVQIKLPDLSVSEFYRAALAQLGELPESEQRAALMNEFETCLERNAAARRVVVVVVDSAEMSSVELLQELLKLSFRSAGSVGNLCVVLAGRPALEGLVARASARSSQVSLHLRLNPLEPGDTERYIRHRIAIAGGNADELIEKECYGEFQRYAGGMPRLLNTLADTALVNAFNRNRIRVATADIRSAVDQLQWTEFSVPQPAPSIVSHAVMDSPAVREPAVGRLRIEREGRVLVEFQLPVGKIAIGRAKNNDVRIDSQFISRNHCHILTTQQYSVIEDLQSQNGIVVDGRRVSVHRMRDGDEIDAGDLKLVFTKVLGVPLGDTDGLFPLVISAEGSPVEARPVEDSRTRVLNIRDRLGRP